MPRFSRAPEVFKAVSMDATVHVLDSMVNDLMGIIVGESIVGEQRIGVESRASFNMLFDFGLRAALLAVCDNLRANLAAPLQDAHDGSLILPASPGDATLALLMCMFRALPPMKVSSASTSPDNLARTRRAWPCECGEA